MPRPETLPAFTPDQKKAVHAFLAVKVAYMMGRKFEEGDWAEIYCKAKGIPIGKWSNLNIDVMHDLLGVEHKMLCCRSGGDIQELCGQTLMHPAATRSLRMPSTTIDPNEAMRNVFTQYGELIQQRTEKVRSLATSKGQPDMRTGWLLWQQSLRQFLYFEEQMLAPDPSEYDAKWTESGGGVRKKSKNLWIYEKGTGKKRYSVTTEAGIKLQPYFDIPPPGDPNLYIFTVIGEAVSTDLVRVWVTESTAKHLAEVLGDVHTDFLSKAILTAVSGIGETELAEDIDVSPGVPLVVTRESYQALCAAVGGINDDHRFQLLLRCLQRKDESKDKPADA